jgi:hypothetical protein
MATNQPTPKLTVTTTERAALLRFARRPFEETDDVGEHVVYDPNFRAELALWLELVDQLQAFEPGVEDGEVSVDLLGLFVAVDAERGRVVQTLEDQRQALTCLPAVGGAVREQTIRDYIDFDLDDLAACESIIAKLVAAADR